MLKMENEENQAEKLQQLFAEVTNQPKEKEDDKEKEATTSYIEVDVLNLPPRSEVHQKPKRKFYVNLKSPFVRLLLVLFILLIIISLIYYVAGEQIILFFS